MVRVIFIIKTRKKKRKLVSWVKAQRTQCDVTIAERFTKVVTLSTQNIWCSIHSRIARTDRYAPNIQTELSIRNCRMRSVRWLKLSLWLITRAGFQCDNIRWQSQHIISNLSVITPHTHALIHSTHTQHTY